MRQDRGIYMYLPMNRRKLLLFLILFCAATFVAEAQVQRGIASYYAKSWTGRKTANGDRLHHDSMTCAHLKYPFGTRLKVTNPANGKVVIVRVNDRGPYAKKRIIDLSWGAAKALGILNQGIAMVTVERVTNDIVIPIKPEDDPVPLPDLELSTHENDGDSTPEWQQLPIED